MKKTLLAAALLLDGRSSTAFAKCDQYDSSPGQDRRQVRSGSLAPAREACIPSQTEW
jgi:hypothetical protein